MNVRSITSLPRENIGEVFEEQTTATGNHACQDRRDVENLCRFRKRRGVVHDCLRIVAVHVCELIGLMVDHDEDGVFRTKK